MFGIKILSRLSGTFLDNWTKISLPNPIFLLFSLFLIQQVYVFFKNPREYWKIDCKEWNEMGWFKEKQKKGDILQKNQLEKINKETELQDELEKLKLLPWRWRWRMRVAALQLQSYSSKIWIRKCKSDLKIHSFCFVSSVGHFSRQALWQLWFACNIFYLGIHNFIRRWDVFHRKYPLCDELFQSALNY